MSLQALMDLAELKPSGPDYLERLILARAKQRLLDIQLETQVRNKRVGPELLAKTCSI